MGRIPTKVLVYVAWCTKGDNCLIVVDAAVTYLMKFFLVIDDKNEYGSSPKENSALLVWENVLCI